MHDELIARLEAATGADRELDAAIFDAIGAPLPQQAFSYDLKLQPDPDKAGSYVMPIGEMLVRYEAPAFTSSIDAALTLVPEGWLWRIMPSDFKGWLAEAWTDDTLDGEFGACAATPALAICIAALRAKGGGA